MIHRLSCILIPLLLAVSAARPVRAASIPPSQRTVILISIDGFPAWLWRDPAMPIPNLRRLAASGVSAEAMTVSNPSITWINHTTLVTGVTPRRHGVLYNGLLLRGEPMHPPTLEQWRDKAELVHVPTVYDAAHQAGLKTAEVDWVAILNSGTIDYEFLELPKLGGAIEKELIDAGEITAQDIQGFTKGSNIAYRDLIWTKAAAHIIKRHHPNFLLFHLLSTDAANHAYGPGSTASYVAYAYADAMVGELERAVHDAGLDGRTTYVVATDHGFKKVRRTIDVNVPLKDAGLLRLKGTAVSDCDAYAMPEGGLCFVYVTNPSRRDELLPRLKELCAGIEGVAQVIDGQDAPSLGMPTPAENPGCGELILFAKPGYAFLKSPNWNEAVVDTRTYLGTHGYPATDPELDGIFIASGYGIKPGTHLGRISNLDVAPTVARLLGVQMNGIDGHAREEILEPDTLPKQDDLRKP
jgi:predicted AlkP superfamily pyrophosphatase or phosphodiesterase